LALVAAATALADGPVSLDLVDPATGAPVTVTSGAPLLHVVLFATWCPPCVEELDALAELEARWQQRGYTLVLVAVQTRHSADRLVRFSAERTPPGRLLHDASGQAPGRLGGEALPTHVLIGPGGQVLLRAAAYEDGVEEAVERFMQERGEQR